jgi:hypothetical protein
VAGCNSSSDNSSSDGNETVQGRITGFGSIFVSGVEYETDNASITVDGKPASEDELELGMMVTVHGHSSGAHGHADSVDFNNNVDGVITEVNLDQNGVGTITVMGYTVTVDENTMVKFKTTDIDSLAQAIYDPNVGIQYVAEVSGYSDGQGNIHSTRIEVKAFDPVSGKIEIDGYVKNHDSSTSTFMIANMQIVYTTDTQFDGITSGMVTDGMHVEVKGSGFDDQGRLIAEKIENKNHHGVNSGHPDDDYDIEGVVSSITDENFQINGQTVYYNQDTLGVENLVENALVEVKAFRDDQDRLVAYKIETDQLDGEHYKFHSGIEMKGMVQAIDIDNNTLQLMDKIIYVNASTMMCDDYAHNRYFNLQDIDLSAGDYYVEVKAYLDDNGNLVASKLSYEGANSGKMDELQGPLTVDDSGAYVMGIAINFGDFTVPMTGAYVALKGTYSGGMFHVSAVETKSDHHTKSGS